MQRVYVLRGVLRSAAHDQEYSCAEKNGVILERYLDRVFEGICTTRTLRRAPKYVNLRAQKGNLRAQEGAR